MHLGIDIGTSSVKALVLDDAGRVAAEASAPLAVDRPHPLWSEQDPDAWWRATATAVRELPAAVRLRVAGLGLSGQMHGAVVLGGDARPLRPAILWNDGRSEAECAELLAAAPDIAKIAGSAPMPGFTAPKLLWLRRHEPQTFAAVRRILLPKDYVRLRLTGAKATDMSDASGTLWLDAAARRWSPDLISACGLSVDAMPEAIEGTALSGRLRPAARAELGLPDVWVAAGGGDNAASAVGAGVVRPGDALLSLGTSGVIFVVDDGFRPGPAGAGLHAFCHALPELWHRMAVTLSAASAVDWAARVTGSSVSEAVAAAGSSRADDPVFLPYLSGERTPHNDPHARGVWFGLSPETDAAALVRAAMEGVAFALADGFEALGAPAGEAVEVVGGGARLDAWAPVLASALGRELAYGAGGELGGARGAARLAMIACSGANVDEACARPATLRRVPPSRELVELQAPRRARFRRLYRQLASEFRETAS